MAINAEMDVVAKRVSLLLSEPDMPDSSSSIYSSSSNNEDVDHNWGHDYEYDPEDDASFVSSQDSDDWLTLDLHFLETAARTAKLDSRKAQLVLGLISDGKKAVREWSPTERGRTGRGVWTPVKSVRSGRSSGRRQRGRELRCEELPLLPGKGNIECANTEQQRESRKREKEKEKEKHVKKKAEVVVKPVNIDSRFSSHTRAASAQASATTVVNVVGLAKPVSFAAHRHSVSLVDNPAPSRRSISNSRTPAPLSLAGRPRASLDRERTSRSGGRESAMGFVNFSRPLSISLSSPIIIPPEESTQEPTQELCQKQEQKKEKQENEQDAASSSKAILAVTPTLLPLPSPNPPLSSKPRGLSPIPSPLSIRIPPTPPRRVVRDDIGLPRTPSHNTLAVARPIFQRVDSKRGRLSPVSGKSDVTFHPYQRHKRVRKGSLWSSLPVCGLDGLVLKVRCRSRSRGRHTRLHDEKERPKEPEGVRLRKARTGGRAASVGATARVPMKTRRAQSASATSRVKLTEDNLRQFEGKVGSVPRPIDISKMPSTWKTGTDVLKTAQGPFSGRLVDKRLPTPPLSTGPSSRTTTPTPTPKVIPTAEPTNAPVRLIDIDESPTTTDAPSPPPKVSNLAPAPIPGQLHPPLIPPRYTPHQFQPHILEALASPHEPFYQHANTAVSIPHKEYSFPAPAEPVATNEDRNLDTSICAICNEEKFVSAFPVRQCTAKCRHAPHACWRCVERSIRRAVDALKAGVGARIACLECGEGMKRDDVRAFAEDRVWERYKGMTMI